MAAWKLFGHATTAEQLPAELRSILAQMQRERVAFETLTNAARESGQHLTHLAQPISDAQKVVSELQARVKALERLVPVLATLDEQTEAVSRVQRRTETQLTHTSEDAKRLRTEIDELHATFEQALALKNDLVGFLELGGGFKALRMDADKLTAEVRDVTQGFDRVRERQEELRRTSEAVATRLQTFEERQQQVQGGVATTESRVATIAQTLQDLNQAATDAVQTKRQLGTLKALADAVTQKVAALEQQRDIVDRASAQVARLHDLMREIDAKIRKHEESSKGLSEFEAKVNELKALHGDVLERSEQISGRHDEVQQADEELRARLATLRDEVQRTVQRFELENQGLDAVSQRILGLRGGLTDMETRFRSLEESSRTITDVRSKVDGLATQLSGMTESLAELEAQADRLSQSVAQIEARRQLVENLNYGLSELASLGGQLEERSRGLLDRMEGADERFKTLAAHAEEAGRIEQLVPAAIATLEGAERRVADVGAAVSSLEARAQNLDGLAERTRALGQELEPRQAALRQATEPRDGPSH